MCLLREVFISVKARVCGSLWPRCSCAAWGNFKYEICPVNIRLRKSWKTLVSRSGHRRVASQQPVLQRLCCLLARQDTMLHSVVGKGLRSSTGRVASLSTRFRVTSTPANKSQPTCRSSLSSSSGPHGEEGSRGGGGTLKVKYALGIRPIYQHIQRT